MRIFVSSSGGVISATKPLSKREIKRSSKPFKYFGCLSQVSAICAFFSRNSLKV